MAMKKLSLSVDALQVESFETTKLEEKRGTVDGHSPGFGSYHGPTCETTCYLIACDCTELGGTCNASYGGTCLAEDTCAVEECDFTNYNCPSGVSRPGCC